MATFLFTTLPTNDLGLVTRALPIAAELEARGHEVVFCSPASAPRRLIAEAGFANALPRHPIYDLIGVDRGLRGLLRFLLSGRWRTRHPNLFAFLRELVPALPLRSAPGTSDVWDVDHAAALMGMLNEGFVRANCRSLAELVSEVSPDLVVDFWNPLAGIAARATGTPLVTVTQADAHPASSGFLWWRSDRPLDLPSPVGVVNRVLRDLGLPPVGSISELSVGDRTLVVGMPETDPLPPDADVTYLGTILWQRPGEVLPAAVQDLGRHRPLVWVYTGNPRYATAGAALDSDVVFSSAVEALGGEDLDVVVTTGYHRLPDDLPGLPGNFLHLPYVPGLAMAERSDLLIHHGGYGSCQTGLSTGTPAVIVPTFSERESNARRIAALGAGVLVPVERRGREKAVDHRRLRAAVRWVLGDPSFHANARRAGEKLRGLGGAPRAADLIEETARGAGTSTS